MPKCLNPESVTDGDILPKVDNITIDFWWLSLDEVWTKQSIDAFMVYGETECAEEITEALMTRKRKDCGYGDLVDSIRNLGFLDPVFCDREYGNGHHRLAAALELGYTHIPCTKDASQAWRESGDITEESSDE